MSKRRRRDVVTYPHAYSRYTKTHFILYTRQIQRFAGYTYRRKIKRRWRIIKVPTRTVVSYVETYREPIRVRRAPALRPKRAPRQKEAPTGAWITKEDWLRGIEDKYENFDRGRSDLPPSNIRWFRLTNNFLWIHRRWPPLNQHAQYALVLLYILVWDREDEIHKIFVQRLRTIRPDHAVIDMDRGKYFLSEIEKDLPNKFEAQKKKLEQSGFDTEGVDVKGLAGWSVVPDAEWWIDEQKRLEKRRKYWEKRDRLELQRRDKKRKS